MSRFEQELSGALGEYWKKDAEKRIEQAKNDITVDANGVARNKIGRAIMSDMVEVFSHTGIEFDKEATEQARDEEVTKSIAEYKANARPATAEELAEMRNAFGEGATVVDVLTGKKIQL